MEQLPPPIEQLLIDLESRDPAVRQAAAVELGQMTTSSERIVAALEKVASAGGTPYDGSAQAATAASTALLAPAHRKVLAQMGHSLPVQSLYFDERQKPLSDPKALIVPVLWPVFLAIGTIVVLSNLRDQLLKRLDLETGSETVTVVFYFVGIVFVGLIMFQGMRDSLHGRQRLTRSLAIAMANVVDRRKEKVREATSSEALLALLELIPAHTYYYVKLEFEATQADGNNKTILLEAQVKKDIYECLSPGTAVQVRYATQDPRIVLLDGE